MKRLLLLITICISSVSFGQIQGEGVTDIDGNIYETVIIGTQEWMAENLKTEKFNNGDNIVDVVEDNDWSSLITPAYCALPDVPSWNTTPYNFLYNGYTVIDSRNVCPNGWRIPSEDDWTVLTNFLGGWPYAGDKIKATNATFGFLIWCTGDDPDNSNNLTGFSGVPSGLRWYNGGFSNYCDEAIWWTSTPSPFNQDRINTVNVGTGYSELEFGSHFKGNGLNIRCLKNDDVGLINLNSEERKIIKIVNLLGQEVEYAPNTVLIYQYSDGTSEKIFTIED